MSESEESATEGADADQEWEEDNTGYDIKRLCPVVNNNKKTWEFLVDYNVFKKQFRCSKKNCRRDMAIVEDQSRADGAIWRCPKCSSKKSLRKGSYFERSKLPSSKLLLLCYTWAFGVPAYAQARLSGVSEQATSRWNQYIRDVCSTWLVRNPVRMGGKGVVVQVDESVMVKRKYNRGHMPAGAQRWVFGIWDSQTRNAYIQFVEDRKAETLIPIIKKICEPGTIIYSDCFRSYARLNEHGFEHATVNHERFFTDPVTGVTTNNIESSWNSCKRKFKAMVGTSEGQIESYLDEWMWRQYHGKKSENAFHSLLGQMGELWPWK